MVVNMPVSLLSTYAVRLLLGHILYLSHLKCPRYLRFVEHVLPEFLEDVPLVVRQRMWLQHYGTLPDFNVDIRDYLIDILSDLWFGRRGEGGIPWPARSRDLNLRDYFLWCYLKSLVCETTVKTDMELIVRIVAACDRIQNTRGTFWRVPQNP